MDWNLVRFIWFLTLIGFMEFRLGLTPKQAALVNSPLVTFPQLLKSLRPNPNPQAWGLIRKWLQYSRLLCITLLAIFVASWIKLALIESMFFILSIVVLLPSLILSHEDYMFIYSGEWLFVPREPAPEKVLPEVVSDLLEPAPYYWQLIGECYVDGMMDGEAITYQNRKAIRPEVFEIR
jgi:hypothetical protein